jgi:ribosome-binding factor A
LLARRPARLPGPRCLAGGGALAARAVWKGKVSEGRRSERIGELVLRELGAMLVRDLKDPRLRGVTITRISVSADLRHCRVFFSHLEGKARAAAAVAGFHSAAGYIRREIGHALGLRYAPDFDFEFDPGPEHSARIDTLLRDALDRR